jgi:hypothetical protein
MEFWEAGKRYAQDRYVLPFMAKVPVETVRREQNASLVYSVMGPMRKEIYVYGI